MVNEEISEIIKDLSQALLAIVSAACLLYKTFKKKKDKSKKRKR